MVDDLYSQIEPSLDISLKHLYIILNSDFGLINNIFRKRQYYDDPKFWYFSASINPKFSKNDGKKIQTNGSGYSFFSEDEALLKCLAETVERYCNFVFLNSTTDYIGTYNNSANKFNPQKISAFSQKQLNKKGFDRYRITGKSQFRWTKCKSLTKRKDILFPSQFIYLSYPYLKDEPSIYTSISTGCAGGGCLSAAIVRGIFEIIERDSYMIFYLNKLHAPKIELETIEDSRIKKFIEISKRYKLEIISLDITTDLGVPTVASIVIDRTGIGKTISVGLKSDFNIIDCIIGSISESFHTRSWLREVYEDRQLSSSSIDIRKNLDLKQRGLLWYSINSIDKLDFWINSNKKTKLKYDNKNLDAGKKLEKLVKIFTKKDYDVLYKNILVPSLEDLNYFVVKVIIPQMQPIYLNEEFPLLGSERLYYVPKALGYKQKIEKHLNKYPHPFL